jgi:hypothetical protein
MAVKVILNDYFLNRVGGKIANDLDFAGIEGAYSDTTAKVAVLV